MNDESLRLTSDPLSHECTYCGAIPNRPCRALYYGYIHEARIRLAQRALWYYVRNATAEPSEEGEGTESGAQGVTEQQSD